MAMIWLSIAVGGLFWLADTFVGVRLNGGESFWMNLVDGGQAPHRLFAVAVILLMGVAGQTALNRKRREESFLRSSHQRINDVTSHAREWVWEVDADNRFTFVSSSVKTVLGYRPEDLVGKKVTEFYLSKPTRPAEQKAFRPEGQRAFHRYIVEFRHKSGMSVVLEISGTPIFTAGGVITGYRGASRDITEARQSEAKRGQEEARLKALVKLNQMPDASEKQIMKFTLENALTLTQSAYGLISQVDETESQFTVEAYSQKVLDSCPVQQSGKSHAFSSGALARKLRQNRTPIITNDYPSNPDNKKLPEWHLDIKRHMAAPLVDCGKMVMVASLINKEHEYTEHDARQVELLLAGMWQIIQRRRAAARLAASERRYQDLYDNAPDIYLTVGHDGIIKSVNQYGAHHLGYMPKDIMGRFFWYLVHPEDKERVREMFNRPLSNLRFRFEVEHRLVHRNGKHIWVQQRSHVLLDEEGRAKDWHIICRDISERRSSHELQQLAAKVIENSVEGVLVADSALITRMVNPAYTALTGYEPFEVIGKEARILRDAEPGSKVVEEIWRGLTEKGQWSGEVWNRRKNGESYPEWLTVSVSRDSMDNITNYICVFHDMTAIKHREKEIQYLADHDALTGLPNRLLFNDRLQMALAGAQRRNARLAIMFLDLDQFKEVNDTMGHDAGDELLRQVGQRLTACVRDEDTVARIGGDEFLIILQEIGDENGAADVAGRVLDELNRSYELKGHKISSPGASIGVSVFPEDGRHEAELVRKADQAMYRAKQSGKNNYQFYKDNLNGKLSVVR